MLVDPDRVRRLIVEVAAEEALPRFRALADSDIRRKSAGDLVTVADLAVERQLARRLGELLPDALVVGEEAVEADASRLRAFEQDRPVWIIDPIDGTGNFAHGRPTFAVMVGLTRGRELLAGWIHDPIGGATALAEAGAGAYLDGRRLQVAAPAPLAEMRGTLHAGTYGSRALGRKLEARRERVTTLKSLRCAGHEYLRLARGEMHFSLFSRTKPWDHVPGLLIHREAGGHGCLIDGRAYGPLDDAGPGLLMAPDRASWQALHDTLLAD